MRPSNKRSRSKQNRPRTLGNIINRVFDSSGPEGKVRGTPQQIIDKYQVLARDAQLSGDRVAAENFLQHAEHYTRMLNEATAELAREAEQRQGGQQNSGHNSGQNGQQNGQPRRNDDRDGGQGDGGQDRYSQDRQGDRRDDRGQEPRADRQNDRSNDRSNDRRDDRGQEPRADRQNDRSNDRPNDRQNDRQNDRPNDRQSDRPADRPNDRQSDRPADRPNDRPNDRREDRIDGRIDFLGRRNRRFEGRNRPEGDAAQPRDDDSMLVETPESRTEPRVPPRADQSDDRPVARADDADRTLPSDSVRTDAIAAVTETPDAAPRPPRPPRAPRRAAKPAPEPTGENAGASVDQTPPVAAPAEGDAPAAKRTLRRRRPASEAEAEGEGGGSSGPADTPRAAE